MPPTWKWTRESLRNFPFKVEPCTSPIFLVHHMWPVQEYPSSRIPTSHWILSCSRPLLFDSHLIVLPFTLPEDTSPVQCHQSSFMYTITFPTVVSDSKTSVVSATLSLIKFDDRVGHHVLRSSQGQPVSTSFLSGNQKTDLLRWTVTVGS
jgi:hypothetical protein